MSETELLPTKALQRIEAPPPAPLLSGVNIEALLSKAVDAKAAVEVLERLAVMRREMKAEAAKEAFDHALAEFQAECPVIKKDQQVYDKNNKPRYRFAPLDSIVGQTKELLRKHGFSYSLTAAVEPQWVTAILSVKHSAGHSERSEFKIPIDDDAYMSAPQKFGSALTFAKRYAFCDGFGILTGDYDDDARASDPEHAAGQDRRPTQQQFTPRPVAMPRATAPAASADPKPFPTAATRLWAIKELTGDDAFTEAKKSRLHELLVKTGCLLETETLTDWPFQFVPMRKAEIESVRKALAAFEAGDPVARFPVYQGVEPTAEPEPKPKAKSAKPIEVPRDPDVGDQSTAPVDINPEWEKATGIIDRTSFKNGKSNRGPWEMWGIKIGEDWYNTFSSRIGKLAEANKGREVDLYFSANERGKNAEHIEV